MNPIFLLTGPPGAGKTTLARAILQRFEFGYHLEVDTLRTGVVRGLADSVPWTDETERQFQIAEAATCDVARRYQDAGFAVVIDHCRNLPRLNAIVAEHFAGRPVVQLCLLPDLGANLARNLARTNKDFDPAVLTDTIRFVHEAYSRDHLHHPGWIVIDNTSLSVDEALDALRDFVPPAK